MRVLHRLPDRPRIGRVGTLVVMAIAADAVQVHGEIEGSRIAHADLPCPHYGEGLLEAFDPGLI